jgi:DNA polymerase-3 subunit epsilon
VTKKVRLVVAADTDSLSGKAKKARGYGIPVMSVDDFRTALGYPSPAPGEFAASRDWGNSESQWAKALRNEAGK